MQIKFLHIFSPSVGCPHEMIRFIRENFPQEEHQFLVMADKNQAMLINPMLLSVPDIIYLPFVQKRGYKRWDRILYVKRLFNSAQHLVWHSYLSISGNILLCLCARRKYLKKSVWIEHGQDLYQWKEADFGLKRRIKNRIILRLRSNVKHIGLTLPSDEVSAKEISKMDARCYNTPSIVAPWHLEELQKYLSRPNHKMGTRINILVGYDGQPYNQHGEIIKSLSCFSHEDLKIICPMNWSMYFEWGLPVEPLYRQAVRLAAKENNLASKLSIYSVEDLSEERYFGLLNVIDIAVFAGERPIEMDLLLYLLYLQKKVYLPGNQPLFQLLCNQGFTIFDTNAICDQTFASFSASPPLEENTVAALQWLDEKKIKVKWQHLFEEIAHEKN